MPDSAPEVEVSSKGLTFTLGPRHLMYLLLGLPAVTGINVETVLRMLNPPAAEAEAKADKAAAAVEDTGKALRDAAATAIEDVQHQFDERLTGLTASDAAGRAARAQLAERIAVLEYAARHRGRRTTPQAALADLRRREPEVAAALAADVAYVEPEPTPPAPHVLLPSFDAIQGRPEPEPAAAEPADP